MSDRFVDLDEESRGALDFDVLLGVVAGYAVSEEGRRRVRGLRPLRDGAAVRREQESVGEVVREVGANGRLLPVGLPDPLPALAALEIEAARASTLELRDLARVLLGAAALRGRLLRLAEKGSPRLRAMGRELSDLRGEARPIADCVEPDGRIADGASPELGRLRRAVAGTSEAIRRRLEGILREPGSAGAFRDDYVTERNGRFVIPVRSDRARSVRGIVHGVSSSGATLFVEPLETVEMNNELVRLREQELEEQERVLRAWMARLRERLSEVRQTVERVLELDSLQARALFALRTGAEIPLLEEGGPLELAGIRHPLLDRKLQEQGGRAVPFDLRLEPPDRVLVVSGPNAGGKTVVLKTIGLAVLMAQSGIPVTARRARLPLYAQVKADVGDRQSIEADLSTFSAHVQAVSSVLSELVTPSLVLLDEVGTGTEPSEGAALAQAILERLRRPGVTAVATTHLGRLKAWALTADGAATAAMEFDEAALRPTFRLVAGVAGVSAGISIAERLGLDPGVIARARAVVASEDRDAESALGRLHELLRETEARKEELARRREELARERERGRLEVEAELARLRGWAREEIEATVRGFRQAARSELEALRDRAEHDRLSRLASRAEARLRDELRKEAARHEPNLRDGQRPTAGAETFPGELRPGTRVRVLSLDREGEIVGVRKDRVELRLGAVSFSASRCDVVPVPAGTGQGGEGARTPRATAAEAAGETAELRGCATRDLLLLGRKIEEALEEVDRFLDSAALDGMTEVRLVHGHGTGRLRLAVRRHLSGHPLVASYRPGRPSEGGDGATVVRLR